MSISKVSDGNSKSGEGKSSLILPALKWVYTEESQERQGVHIHLPSAWSEKNLRNINLENNNRTICAHFEQNRVFLKKERLRYGKKGLEQGHVKVQAMGKEVDRIYKTKLVKDNGKKYPYCVRVDLSFEVEDLFDVKFMSYSVKDAGMMTVLELDFESKEKPENRYTTKIRSETLKDEFFDSDEGSDEEEEDEMFQST